MRAQVPEYKVKFSDKKIALNSKLTRPKDYEAGHAFGKSYRLPLTVTEEELVDDLRALVRLYIDCTARGGIELSSDIDNEEEEISDYTSSEKPQYKYHKRIERNASASKRAKDAHGRTCQACSFNFGEVYGSLGEGFIEAHHLLPLSQLPKGQIVELNLKNDFAVLCANCHRMMHRKNAPKTVEELKNIIEKIRSATEK